MYKLGKDAFIICRHWGAHPRRYCIHWPIKWDTCHLECYLLYSLRWSSKFARARDYKKYEPTCATTRCALGERAGQPGLLFGPLNRCIYMSYYLTERIVHQYMTRSHHVCFWSRWCIHGWRWADVPDNFRRAVDVTPCCCIHVGCIFYCLPSCFPKSSRGENPFPKSI